MVLGTIGRHPALSDTDCDSEKSPLRSHKICIKIYTKGSEHGHAIAGKARCSAALLKVSIDKVIEAEEVDFEHLQTPL